MTAANQFWQSLIESLEHKNNAALPGYHSFRHESGKLVSVLTKVFGTHNLELAEDVVQDTLLKALDHWKIKGIPDDPSAWLFTVARNRVLDHIRREKRQHAFASDIAYLLQSEYTLVPTVQQLITDKEIEDDLLRMMFACCHPALPVESQVAMILKTLCGFSVPEVSKAFVTTQDTIEKRLYRAKQQFRLQKIAFEIPALHELEARLDNVLLAIYLLFNEGYSSTRHEDLVRKDLLDEASRLAQLLAGHPATRSPRVWALLALMCFTNARNNTRLDQLGNIQLLRDQDRGQWDQQLIRQGMTYLTQSAEGSSVSTYHLEAAIAFEHCTAPSFAQTNWRNILHFYDLLYQLHPTPVVALNRAIVVSETEGPAEAIRSIVSIPGIESLQQYHLLHSTLGQLHAQLEEKEMARFHFEKALLLTQSGAEQKLLKDKLKRISS
ncbi:MAG TPA: sigma-70 family RNA polymerase sigma factor [Puia sp.]|nr:sigma-70 family RNA polymerase sigma factor [Puia sp.]